MGDVELCKCSCVLSYHLHLCRSLQSTSASRHGPNKVPALLVGIQVESD